MSFKSIRFKSIIGAISVCAALLSFNANAVTITGDLSYDNTTDLITNTNTGKQYLGWDVLASTTYGSLLPLLGTGGTYEGFHLASQTEALDFFYAAASFDPVAAGFNRDTFSLSGTFFPNQFGGAVSRSSLVFFLSDITTELGFIYSQSDGLIEFNDNAIEIAPSIGGSCTVRGGGTCQKSFLLVSNIDAQVQVPEPSMLALMGLGLIGMFGINRRKLQA